MELALAACLGWVITTCVFAVIVKKLVDALAEKDRHHALHTSGLLNRIQAPQEAVTKDLIGDEDYEPVVLPHTEASYWKDVEHVRLVPDEVA